MSANNVSLDLLRKRIKDILKDADLETMTAKKVRKQLETEFNVDLIDYKKKITDIIEEVINSRDESNEESENETSNDKPSDDSSSDDEKFARKLQEEESSGSRSTRSGTKGNSSKKTKTKNSKKRKKTDSDSEDQKPKKRNSGYMKTCQLSAELAAFVGESELPRHEVVKKIWGYVKEKNLFDPKNKQFAICDNELMKVFGVKRVKLFGMMKILSKHIK
ncbi:hypothetical protein B4U79_14325 [Dinothrombium tinctorium]|uniref:Uncharacterized protein n=1 Tax=Dinothrombium tinctorium TaxID=1965070 RepID=A0A3S3P3E8_9ACAR|nr:hypothetical protein B4U79_01100 [Dinothrombium tinctorium]RWS13981.1 hypothetical protein B4U79_14325 [Dinothrombium tinctorium]